MRTSEQIKAEIEGKFGFFPPFFSPALYTPQVLENLWHQTVNAYVNNPLPALFKEKLSAYLSRFCVVPYCMICHSCSLYFLGIQAKEVLELLESPPPTVAEIDEHLLILAAASNSLTVWPESNSALETSILCCSIVITLERDQATHCRQELRRLLGDVNYQHLVTFIAYVKTCHTWMEAYPEVAYSTDKRAIANFDALVQEEPGLADFFANYWERVRREQLSWVQQLAASAERQRHEQQLRKAAAENLRLARAIASVSDGVLITDPNQPDNPIIYSNPAFSRITGYSADEIMGRNCRFLQGPDTDQQAVAQIRHAFAHRQEVTVTLLNYRKNGQPFWNELKIAPIFSEQGDLLYCVGVQTDITDRKQAEETLKQSETSFRLLFTSNPQPMWVFDRDTLAFLAVNDAAIRHYGYSHEEFLAMTIKDIRPREDIPALLLTLSQSQPGIAPVGTWKHCRKDGTLIDVEITAHPLTFAGRNAVVILANDVTDRLRASSALVESNKRITNILASITDGFFALDNEWQFTYLNPQAERLLRKTRAELLGKNVWDEFPQAVGSKFYQEYHQVVSQQVSVEFEEFYPAENIWFEVRAYPSSEGLSVYFRDISDRKRTEEKIRFQAALLDITTDAILVRDLENRILFWNQGASHLYGWQAAEVLDKNAMEVLNHGKTPQVAEAFSTVTTKGLWQGELAQVTKDGKKILVESRWTLMRDEGENPQAILVVNTDITERKQLEAQFFRAQRLESIGTLSSGIAHDLNNVLAPILSAAQLLLRFPIPEEKKLPLLSTIESSAKRGAALVKQVLSFARGVEGERTEIQLKHLITEIRQIVLETFPKSIELYTDIPQEPWMVSGDATQLHQVLMNLCVNARDAMPGGGVLTLKLSNTVIDESYARMKLDARVGSYVVLSIRDTGTGMPPEVVERIFEPFFTTKELGKGTGLGLSTVLTIVKSHGGFVEVKSTVAKGTEISVYLPAIQATATVKTEYRELCVGQGELILVVDDEAAIREINKASLEMYNYRVLTASDGIEAIALYAQYQEEISLVLIDMMMPSMDGVTTIRTLQKINPLVKIIAVSGLVSNAQLAQSAGSGVQGFLSKPYTAVDLLKTMNEVLRGKDKDKKGFVLPCH